ncbi:MAG: relaxase/mobilization nuclease domain-containing protein [Oribacterium sp.]|nr:relaxase/mobilization nuclease domain-containing protein [Oribacterium sp.]
MAINKVVNKSTKNHGAMRNVIEYVLRDEKIKEGYVEVTGPYAAETINYDDVYKTWLSEKKLWNKDSGRMYAHNIISFHKDENVTPAEVLAIGKEFSDKFFSGHQCVIGVHQDKDHLHCHIVTNSVSYIDGMKLHQTKRDLQQQKDFTNVLCLERGLSIAEKGQHFDGSTIEQGEITAWSKDKYNLLINDSKKSFVAECAIAILETVPESTSREEFISGMEERGWSVQWEESRKHIVFQNEDGKKVRDTNIEKTFAGMEINKEALLNEFTRQNELRLSRIKADRDKAAADAELKRYYAELESAAAGLDNAKAIRNDPETSDGVEGDLIRTGISKEAGENIGHGEDTRSFIRELDSQEKASAEERNNRIAERKDRNAEQRRLSIEREQALKAEQQRIAKERAERQSRSISHGFSR